MSRKIRADYAGAAHHVMARDNQKEEVIADDVDRTIWLHALVEAYRPGFAGQSIESPGT